MAIDRGQPSQTIVRRVSASGGEERFCILHELPLPASNAFAFSCASFMCVAHGVPVAVACDMMIAAGVSESDAYRLLDEARAGHQEVPPHP